MSEGLITIIEFVKRITAFVQDSARRPTRSITKPYPPRLESNISRTTEEVNNPFQQPDELILRILEWMEKMTSQTESISQNVNTLMILSHRLHSRSDEINAIWKNGVKRPVRYQGGS